VLKDMIFNDFHPILCAWFQQKFGEPTGVQEEAWTKIRSGVHTLIASPTGTGKTLAALVPCLDRMIKAPKNAGIRTLYITPLKALNNDIHHHIIHDVEDMEKMAANDAVEWPGIRIAVRSGDTTSSTRASMLRNPPDLLITTPESLYILLTSPKARNMLKTVEQVIVDEIHDLAGDRRGSHLSITLERLAEWCGSSPQRIGLSATQKPLEKVAQFLGGWDEDKPRPVEIVENTIDKKIEIRTIMPSFQRISGNQEDNAWTPIVEQLTELLNDRSTVLIFVNNRRLCERLALRLNDHVGYEMARSHHGSISKEKRLEVEQMLKSGDLKCLVATSSLELGIDVGTIDLVIQIDSPKHAAAGIQRIGRAGHQVDGVSYGVIVAKNRSDLPEIAVLGRLIVDREIEEICIPRNCLDVVSQQVVAMIANDDWGLDQLHNVLIRSDSYREFPRQRLEEMLKIFSGYYPFVRPLIDWNPETGLLQHRNNTSMAAMMGAGTIPQGSNYPVHHQHSRIHLGELDEEYIYESRVGDVFQLGASSWKIQSITNHHVYVTESVNRFSEIPFWKGEALGRSYELGRKVGSFLEELSHMLQSESKEAAEKWLVSNYYLDSTASSEWVRTMSQQMKTSQIPTHSTLVVEYFTDEINHTHLIIHSFFGKRFNRTWMLVLQNYFDKKMNKTPYAFAKDNGMEFIFPEWDPAYLQCFRDVTAQTLESTLLEIIPSTAQFGMTFRRMAEMSLLITRSFKRTPVALKRLRSEQLLTASLPYAEHFPLYREAIHECLHDQLDLQHLEQYLQTIQKGEIKVIIQKTLFPSPFTRMMMSDFMGGKIYEGESIGKQLQLQMLSINKELAVEWFGEHAISQVITPEALAAEEERLNETDFSHIKCAEDVYRLLKQRGDLSQQELERRLGAQTNEWIRVLNEQKRIIPVSFGGQTRWICQDEIDVYTQFPHDETSVLFILSRYIESRLYFRAKDWINQYALTPVQAEDFIEQYMQKNLIEKSPIAGEQQDATWMSKKIVSRLIRSSIQSFQHATNAIDSESFLRELVELHHLTAEKKQGGDGVRQVIDQLQGLFLPLTQWESLVFPARIIGYRKEDLDLLCASGEVLWIGEQKIDEKEMKIAFFLSEAKDLYAPYLLIKEPSKHPELLQLIQQKGASFLTTLSREMDLLPSEMLEKLFDLVGEGHISNDQLAPLRQHALKRGGKTKKTHSGFGRWYSLNSIAERVRTINEEAIVMSWVQQLLNRNGLLCKSSIGSNFPYTWDTLLGVLRQLEDWGMVVRGLFVQDIPSIQFASKEFIEKVRQNFALNMDIINNEDQQITVLSANDPANPYGVFMKWPEIEGISFSRKSGNYLIMYKGKWVMWIENKGKRIHVLKDNILNEWTDKNGCFERILSEIFRTIINLDKLHKIKVDVWNKQPIQESPIAAILLTLGAEKDLSSYVLWSSDLNRRRNSY
jgi:ATP-dependent Lhr-like helicase